MTDLDAIKKLCEQLEHREVASLRLMREAAATLKPIAEGRSVVVDLKDSAIGREFIERWSAFCDSDYWREGFMEDCEAVGLCELRDVREDDLDDAFASERGITPGGMLWGLTEKGRAMLAAAKEKDNG